jgi:resuscitation-promoting factor RpfB
LFRRFGIVFPAAVIAVIVVIGVAVGAVVFAPGSGAFSAAEAIEAVPGSHTMTLLEAEREQLIAMTAAARTLTVVAKPKLASPAQVAAANPGAGSGSGSGSGTAPGSGVTYVTSSPPDPGTAQSTAYNMMASFGFSPQTYFGCLLDIWNRESGWVYDAENASGAYGIPQALPGSKMASAGADWQTDPATQIKWGLGYIKDVYGNPCSAWAFEEANGYY